MSGAYVQAVVEPDQIVAALNEDAEFCREFWFHIAEMLHAGLLLDNSLDVLAQWEQHMPFEERGRAEYIATQLSGFADMVSERVRNG